MQVDLQGWTVAFIGDKNPVAEAALEALQANGAELSVTADNTLVSLPLTPDEAIDAAPVLAEARAAAERMSGQPQGGRLVFLLSAAAGMPMRRHPQYSVQMAAAMTAMRGLAMAFGPHLLVNAVGVGAIGEPEVAGDTAMLSHAAVKRAGTIDEIVDTVLFFCDPLNTYATGQLLSVDGGWSAGYGRNF